MYSRIVPTTPCIARILDEPIELGGYRLDPGVSFIIRANLGEYFDKIRSRRFQTVVLLHTWIAGLSDDNFKDASKCLPERWLKPMAPHSPLLVAPFGAGRRICPGKRFVELALQLILAKVWQSISKLVMGLNILQVSFLIKLIQREEIFDKITRSPLLLVFIQIVREFEIVVEEELGLQFEFILAPQSPVSLGFRDRMSRAEMT